MSNVSKETAAKVKAALVEITDTMPAAQAARVRGFVEPLPLDGMREVLKTLNLPPYKTL
jgi:hypothetical protein